MIVNHVSSNQFSFLPVHLLANGTGYLGRDGGGSGSRRKEKEGVHSEERVRVPGALHIPGGLIQGEVLVAHPTLALPSDVDILYPEDAVWV